MYLFSQCGCKKVHFITIYKNKSTSRYNNVQPIIQYTFGNNTMLHIYILTVRCRYFWIGASDLRQAGVFRWIDGQVMRWSSWRIYNTGEKGNEPNGLGLNEGCVAQNGPADTGVKWYDFPCETPYPSLCQSNAGERCNLECP